MSHPSTLDDPFRLLRDLRALTGLHRDFGIEGYPRSGELNRFLETPPAVVGQTAKPSLPPRRAENNPVPGQDPGPKRAAIRTLEEIRQTLGSHCRCSVQSPLVSDGGSVQSPLVSDGGSVQSPLVSDGATQAESPGRMVFGCGNPEAGLFIVGDLPTPEDEAAGAPFSGEAGELLSRMLKAIGLGRDEVYLSTVIKCRPAAPGLPQPDLVKACLPLLIAQVEAVAPTVICAMGQLTAQALLHTVTPLVRLRGRFHEWHHIALMPTFHPAFLLKNPEMKKATWVDLQLIQTKLKERGQL